MPQNRSGTRGSIARSYDEIARKTVVEPDSSFRPTEEQEHDAYTTPNTRANEERELFLKARDVLLGFPDGDRISIEVEGTRVILRGSVPHIARLVAIVRSVGAIDGVDEVVDKLVVVQ